MSKIISTDVYAAVDCTGQYDQLKRRDGQFYARTVKLYTYGPDQRSPWEPVGIDRAAQIIGWADDPVPEHWRQIVHDGAA